MAREMRERARTFFGEFREFAMRGNVIDLAVGVVIGTAFGKVVSSLVSDIITPILGLLIGGVDFKELSVNLDPLGARPVLLTYGVFLQSVFDFVIIAFSIFLFIKSLNSIKRRFEREQKDAPKSEKPADIALLEEIRDLLKNPRG